MAAALRHEASSLLSRLERLDDPRRRRWLSAQVVALEAQAMSLAGDPLPYTDLRGLLLDLFPERVPETAFANAADDLGRLRPPDASGRSSVVDRLAAWDRRFQIDSERLPAVAAWLLRTLRDRTVRSIGLPEGERMEIAYVAGRQWRVSHSYDGLGSLVEIDRDPPITVAELVQLLAGETYPGHHTEAVWKDSLLVERLGRAEASVSLLNTPARLIGEGLANLSERLIAPDDELADLLVELYARAGLSIASDPVATRDAADRQVRIRRVLSAVRAVPGVAAVMLHMDGVPRDQVLAFLERHMVATPDRTARRMAFIEHPLWRAYAFASFEGDRLLAAGWSWAPRPTSELATSACWATS